MILILEKESHYDPDLSGEVIYKRLPPRPEYIGLLAMTNLTI